MHGFLGPLGLNGGLGRGQSGGRGGAILTPTNSFYFWGSYVCANFGENRSRNETTRVLADRYTNRQTDEQTQTDANRFYNLSHAICYSYGTDNN